MLSTKTKTLDNFFKKNSQLIFSTADTKEVKSLFKSEKAFSTACNKLGYNLTNLIKMNRITALTKIDGDKLYFSRLFNVTINVVNKLIAKNAVKFVIKRTTAKAKSWISHYKTILNGFVCAPEVKPSPKLLSLGKAEEKLALFKENFINDIKLGAI
jgi:hypothetical protein